MEATLEERVAALEAEVARLRNVDRPAHAATVEPVPTDEPWWRAIWGGAKDDPAYEEAMRLGRAYRESLRPTDDADELAQ